MSYAENVEEAYWNEFERQWVQEAFSVSQPGFPNTNKGKRLKKLKKYVDRANK